MANNFPNLLPALNIDMVNGIYVDSRVTFTRAGTRTYYGQEVVKAEENLLLQSQTFDNASWIMTAVTRSANTSVAPDGTTTADTVTEDSTNSPHILNQVPSLGAGTYTMSVFAKIGTGSRFLTIGFNSSASNYAIATFNLSTGENTQTLILGYTSVSATITASAEGYYRCTLTATANSISDVRVGFATTGTHAANSRGFESYTGDGTSSLVIWGAQLEQRSSVTAYNVTTTQPITRYQRLLKTAAANEWPREFDPVTGECLGRSVWESRTNLLLYSEQFDDAYWTKTNATILANQIISPDGTLTADGIITTGATTQLGRFINLTSGIPYTLSVFAKKNTSETLQLVIDINGGAGLFSFFNLNTGTVISTGVGVTRAAISDVGNGWYRCLVVATTTTVGNTPTIRGSGIYIWGAQLE